MKVQKFLWLFTFLCILVFRVNCNMGDEEKMPDLDDIDNS